MDVGVGAFIFSGSITQQRTYKKLRSISILASLGEEDECSPLIELENSGREES